MNDEQFTLEELSAMSHPPLGCDIFRWWMAPFLFHDESEDLIVNKKSSSGEEVQLDFFQS